MIDLQLDETGETPIDLNTETLATDQPMDFDLGEALDASTDATGTVDNGIDVWPYGLYLFHQIL